VTVASVLPLKPGVEYLLGLFRPTSLIMRIFNY